MLITPDFYDMHARVALLRGLGPGGGGAGGASLSHLDTSRSLLPLLNPSRSSGLGNSEPSPGGNLVIVSKIIFTKEEITSEEM